MTLPNAISQAIADASGTPFKPQAQRSISGGCINQSYLLSDNKRSFFVKLNDAKRLPMFEAEAAGLQQILASNTVRAPHPLCHGLADEQAFLVMEYLDLRAHGDAAALGEQLAAMHRPPQSYFGGPRDNTLGSTPQPNTQTATWIEFVRDKRLGYQLRLAAQNGYGGKLQTQGEKLLATLDHFFTDYQPHASLLHGDLWGGNHAYLADGTPVIFDPAVYYGDRETDLAMTELFGGFAPAFYAAYQEVWPLDAGYAERKTLYNLYHILNHANLFGGGYAAQALQMVSQLNAELA
ncbi:MAG: fructosamine kinase family protein [Thiobacillus sp.]